MLLMYMVFGAFGLSLLVLGYGRLVGSRAPVSASIGKKSYPDLWLESLLDCEYAPTKQSYGPARIFPVTKLKLQPITRGCETC